MGVAGSGALRTFSTEYHIQIGDMISIFQREAVLKDLGVGAGEIQNGTALETDEVGVVTADGIVPFVSLVGCHPTDLAKLLQKVQVPVDGSQAQLRKFFLQPGVDHLGGGVIF